MRILIDGYNLLFQSQLVGRGRGPHWLKAARQRLIGHLSSRLTPELASQTRIVFDASQGIEPTHDETLSSGMQIVFANDHPEADDLLEELIRCHHAPKGLTVVSSDMRVRRCARARRAISLDSETFLDRLHAGSFGIEVVVDEQSVGDDSPTMTDEQVNFWLREFGEL